MNSQETTRPQARPSPNRLWQWLDERLGLNALYYEVPPHANTVFYTLGGITLGGIVILVLTGIYMTQFYHPHPGTGGARDSVLYLITRVKFGEFVRGVHFWTANLVIITATLHMVRVFISASYKRPREMNWVIGVVMLTLLFALFFTGTVLKWDQEAYEALAHNEAIGKLLGRFGTFFTNEFTVSAPLLNRMAFVHTAILPGLLTLLIIAHFFLVKHHEISPKPVRNERTDPSIYDEHAAAPRVSYFDLHLRQIVGYSMLLASFAALLALAIPVTLGEEVVPGREVTRPPWLMWWPYALENWWGIKALLWAAVLVPIGLLLVPFVDRTPYRHVLNRKLMLVLAVAVALTWVGMTIYVGLNSRPVAHIGGG